jgi:molybdenum cofactor synthesis domain-containing protein
MPTGISQKKGYSARMNAIPHACLIIIGNEILSGRTRDTNLGWLAEQLNSSGVRMYEARVIPDVEEIIIATVNACRARFDYVFTTGGIGPTHDDITSAAIAKAFGVPLILHPEAKRLLQQHYTAGDLNEARLKMAYIPEGASLIANPVSSAPGFQIGNVFVMAGVPRIMQAMFDDIRPRLRGGSQTHTVTLHTNLAEGTYAARLSEIQTAFPDIEIGSYPHFRQGRVSASLVARGTDIAQLAQVEERLDEMIAELGGRRLSDSDIA